MLHLDERTFQSHAELCKTLASPIRLELLSLLRDGKKSVNELAAQLVVRQVKTNWRTRSLS